MSLTISDGKKLITLARDAINSSFDGLDPDVKPEIIRAYSENRGVFVTLTIQGKLRGCIGYPTPSMPLYKGIIEASRAAAFSDPRFDRLSRDEFMRVKIEISVLTEPLEIIETDPEKIKEAITPGTHGLIIKSMHGSGLLLPQVATEYGWDATAFLENTCQKAGIDRDAWKEPDTTIFTFEAQVFHEDDGAKSKNNRA